jgi:4-hydroxy-3-polyprenylbenzoate decarboxylase
VRVTLAWTGASGATYGLRLLDSLLAQGVTVELLYSKAAQLVFADEADLTLPNRPAEAQQRLLDRTGADPNLLRVYGREQWTAPVASGSNPADAMAVCPCTAGTAAAIAHGTSDNLIERAADVALKERRPLVLVVREMPLSAVHLDNLAYLARLGVTVMPASPGFYHRPETLADLVDFVAARTLDHLGCPTDLGPRWGLGEAVTSEGSS